MEKQQIEEWRILQEEAIKALRNNSRQEGIRLLQLLVIPAFEPVTSYEILKIRSTRRATKYLGIFARWRRDVDIVKFTSPVEQLKYPALLNPTVEHQDFAITADEVGRILDSFKSVSVPPLAGDYAPGLDGTIYELELNNGLFQSRFCWWNEAPIEWQPLEVVFQSTLSKLDAVVATR